VDIVQIPQGRLQRAVPTKIPIEPAASAIEKPTAPDGQPAAEQKVPS
jgi:hypothetical protein